MAASMDKDIRAAIKAGRLTNAEGWELYGLRRADTSANTRIDTLQKKIVEIRKEYDADRLSALEDKAEEPAAVEGGAQ